MRTALIKSNNPHLAGGEIHMLDLDHMRTADFGSTTRIQILLSVTGIEG